MLLYYHTWLPKQPLGYKEKDGITARGMRIVCNLKPALLKPKGICPEYELY